jgi:hypothetical protein
MDVNRIKSGVTAGFVATVILSILMMAKSALGFAPELNPIKDIVTVADAITGAQLPPVMGWLGHFVIGAGVWGALYAWFEPSLPGSPVVKGLLFAVVAWLAMMIVFMPLAGHGFFGMTEGPIAAIATLVLHLAYGAVLGVVYASQSGGAAVADVRPA